jgi:hypothetical protein
LIRIVRSPFYNDLAAFAVNEMQHILSLINDVLEKSTNLSTASKYTAMKGLIYLVVGVLLIVCPGATQTLLLDRAFVGD